MQADHHEVVLRQQEKWRQKKASQGYREGVRRGHNKDIYAGTAIIATIILISLLSGISGSFTSGTSTTSNDRPTSSGSNFCVECGDSTDNPPDAADEVLCDTCTAKWREYNREFMEKSQKGQAYRCEWCGGHAADGDGVCASCWREIERQLRTGEFMRE